MRTASTRTACSAPGPNPMNGPIFVEGAEPGDALKVEIVRMTPIRATGWTRSVLAGNVVDPEFVRDLPPRDSVNWRIDRQALTAQLEPPSQGLENFVLPLEPMIGCFGVAPACGPGLLDRDQRRERRQHGLSRLRSRRDRLVPGRGAGRAVLPRRLPRRSRATARSSAPASRPASRSRCG